jgi:hypothetical protein
MLHSSPYTVEAAHLIKCQGSTKTVISPARYKWQSPDPAPFTGNMNSLLAILLFPAGLVLCFIHLLAVLYVLLVRAARVAIQQVTRRVCRTAQSNSTVAGKDGLSMVARSVRMQGLQVEAAGELAGARWSSVVKVTGKPPGGPISCIRRSHQLHVYRTQPTRF